MAHRHQEDERLEDLHLWRLHILKKWASLGSPAKRGTWETVGGRAQELDPDEQTFATEGNKKPFTVCLFFLQKILGNLLKAATVHSLKS